MNDLTLADVKAAELNALEVRTRYEKERKAERWAKFKARYDANELMTIGEFCPPGTQIKSPSGLSFRPKDLVGVEVRGGLRLIFKSFVTEIVFHQCVDGSDANVWEISHALRGRRWPDEN